MKLTRFTVVLITMLSISTTYAQRFDGALIAGISASQVDGDTQKGYNKPGFFAGVFVETDLNELFSAKIELFYIGKGAVKKINGVEEFNTSLHYIEMPFLMCFKPIDQGQLDVGLAGSYLISSKYKNVFETTGVGIDGMHNFDISAVVSIIYYLNTKIGLNEKLNYSILPVKNDPNWFNSNLCLGLIYKFKKP
jgi:hypothetical protein